MDDDRLRSKGFSFYAVLRLAVHSHVDVRIGNAIRPSVRQRPILVACGFGHPVASLFVLQTERKDLIISLQEVAITKY